MRTGNANRVYEGGTHKRKIDAASFEYLSAVFVRDAWQFGLLIQKAPILPRVRFRFRSTRSTKTS